jgi:phospholipid-translocating ATPase
MSLHMRLLERDRQSVTIKNALGNSETYEVLALFPFSSETKKMSMLVKHKESGRYIYYIKGAEVVMENKVRPVQKAPV